MKILTFFGTTIVLTRSATVNIDYPITSAAVDLFSFFIKDHQWSSDLVQHGCWCAKLDSGKVPYIGLGGSIQVDDLDILCKKWARDRRCTTITGGECELSNLNLASYQVEWTDGIEDAFCPDSDSCLSETCEVDLYGEF